MTGKELLDLGTTLLARTDIDRTMLLFYMNHSIKPAFGASTNFLLQQTQSYSLTNGVANCPTLKNARHVHFVSDAGPVALNKIADIKQLYEIYADPTAVGVPAYYFVRDHGVQVAPAPASGTVLIAGEFWPTELADTAVSTNIFSEKLPHFLLYFGVAEYLDFLQEEARGAAFRTKAMSILEQWNKENDIQDNIGVINLPGLSSGKSLLDLIVSLLNRPDVNRSLLLFHINHSIKTALRSKSYYRLQGTHEYTVTSASISCPTLKNPRYVRWEGNGLSVVLRKLPDIKEVYGRYADPEVSGVPAHYVIKGQTMQLIPAPGDQSTVFIAGEFWPDELADADSSTNILLQEIPDFLLYYGAAEYLDFAQDEKRSQLYRQKALGVLSQWTKENRIQEMSGVNNCPHDPLGSLGYNRRTPPGGEVMAERSDEVVIHNYGRG